MPQTPTIAESGFPGFEAVAWFGLQAPARTPRPIIERVSEATLAAIAKPEVQAKLREVGSEPCSSRRPVYLGGPVPGPLLSLHANSSLSEMEPIPGVYFSARKPNLDRLVLDETSAQKVFLGHSGWGAGQLEQELDAGAWRTIPATAELIFSTDEELWDSVFRQLGRELLKSMLNLKDLPSDPSTN